MRQIGLAEIQGTLNEAFAAGLREKYGPVLAPLYKDVVMYRPHVELDEAALQRCVELDTAPVVKDIVSNKVTGSTLLAFRALVIGTALRGDREAVGRWAAEALNRCRECNGEGRATAAEWQAVLDDPEKFILVARQIKYFMNQL